MFWYMYCCCSYILFFLSKHPNKKTPASAFAETSVSSIFSYSYSVFTLTFFPEKAMPNLKMSVIPSSRISESYLNVVICCNASSVIIKTYGFIQIFRHCTLQLLMVICVKAFCDFICCSSCDNACLKKM